MSGERPGGGTSVRAFRYWGRIGLLLWRLSPWKVVGLAVATLSVSLVPALQLALTATAVQTVAGSLAAGGVDAAFDRILVIGLAMIGVSIVSHLGGTWQQYLDAVLRLELTTAIGELVMRKGTRMDMQDYEDAESYDRLQRAFQESSGSRVHQLFADTLEFVRELVTILSGSPTGESAYSTIASSAGEMTVCDHRVRNGSRSSQRG